MIENGTDRNSPGALRATGSAASSPLEIVDALRRFDWSDLTDEDAYREWREAKLATAEASMRWKPVELPAFPHANETELAEIRSRCALLNYCVYAADPSAVTPESGRDPLRAFAEIFGLRIAEEHRSAEADGVVALSQSNAPGKQGYIPYTDKPLNWHTDGYYNAPEDRIGAFLLHCAQPAKSGGVNQLLDPEIAYLRLRDIDPRFIEALRHPAAMTIPENREKDGSLRPASVGPVFYADPDTGRLAMRYTARTRSIEWRDDPLTREAEAALRELLSAGEPLGVEIRLAAGQGALNNNVLHNRTGFSEHEDPAKRRVMYRVRFRNRVKGA